MLILKRGLSVVLFLPCFILRLLFRYIGLLTILTSGFTTTLILIVARILAFIFLIYPIVILTTEELRMEWASWIAWLLFWIDRSIFPLSSCVERRFRQLVSGFF